MCSRGRTNRRGRRRRPPSSSAWTTATRTSPSTWRTRVTLSVTIYYESRSARALDLIRLDPGALVRQRPVEPPRSVHVLPRAARRLLVHRAGVGVGIVHLLPLRAAKPAESHERHHLRLLRVDPGVVGRDRSGRGGGGRWGRRGGGFALFPRRLPLVAVPLPVPVVETAEELLSLPSRRLSVTPALFPVTPALVPAAASAAPVGSSDLPAEFVQPGGFAGVAPVPARAPRPRSSVPTSVPVPAPIPAAVPAHGSVHSSLAPCFVSRVSSNLRSLISSSRFASKCFTQDAGQALSYALRRDRTVRLAPLSSKQAK
mmetsp:Transcript_13300/g.56194  ORF Transcript_13300/g.56194 Transcript_13300/m.56194 type:complete len:314 (-) Transcript_13300:99-1040(-)